MSIEKGLILNGKYKIIEEIGKGATSAWYKAFILNEDGTENKDLPEVWVKLWQFVKHSFKSEYDLSQELTTHERILKSNDFDVVHLFNEHDKEIHCYEYIITDLMSNGNLFDYVNNECFNEEWARFIFKQILRGVESLHGDGFAHMDLKLGNILLDSNCLPVLADFGVTTRIPKDSLILSTEFKNKGTKRYTCPEILEGYEFNGFLADVFSLGVLLFTLMVGDFPFESATKKDKKYANFYKKSPKLFWVKHSKAKKRISKGSISDSFIDLVTKMLLPNPEERITIENIKLNEWYLQPSMSASEVKEYLEELKTDSKFR